MSRSTSNKSTKSIFGALILISASLFGGGTVVLANTGIAQQEALIKEYKSFAENAPFDAKQILFVDSAVADRQTLLSGISADVKIVALKNDSDGVQQITEVLKNHKNLDSIQIISHGSPGKLALGSTALTDANADTYQAALQVWGGALKTHGDILLYGCDVAQGAVGDHFVNRIAQLTGASVAASIDATGKQALGGNWALEKQVGQVEAKITISKAAQVLYNGILADTTVTFDPNPGFTAGGASFNDGKLTWQNFNPDPNFGVGSSDEIILTSSTVTANITATVGQFTPVSVAAYNWISAGHQITFNGYKNTVLVATAVYVLPYNNTINPGTVYSFPAAFASIDKLTIDPTTGGNSTAGFDNFVYTPIDVPGAPTIGTATADNGQASVTFTAPVSDGGSAITGYTATSSPGGFTSSGCTATPCTVTGLTNGTAYTFTVTATNAVGTGTASGASNSATPATVPDAPTIGTATGGNAQASVAFTAPASNGGSAITGYTAVSSPGGFTSTGCAASPCTVTGLTNGTAYTFTVTATNAVGTGTASGASNSATPATVPDAPTIGTATGGNAQASVAFTAPASNGGSAITGYTATSSPDGFTSSGCTATPCTVTGLTNNTAYTFTVTATNSAGTSAASTASNIVTPVGVPDAPAGATATGGNTQATVSFTAPAGDGGSAITGYTVISSPAGGVDSNAGTTSLNHTITGLVNGTAYTFTVTATNANGTGAASAASNSVTPATIPDAPTIGAATRGAAEAVVTFSAPVDDGGSAITSYTVTSSPEGLTASAAASPITVTGLTDGVAYTFTVTATNGVGTGAASAASNSVSPDSPPVLTLPADITVNAVGLLTPVSSGAATASDSTDGPLTPTSNATSHYSPGVHTVIWSVTDTGGNTITANQTINVIPLVGFSGDQAGREGDAVSFKVILNGDAVTYPVTLPYTVSGTATSITDHDLIDGSVDILAANVEAVITVNLVVDGVLEGDETLIVTLGTPVNAVKGAADIHTLVITETNLPPQVTLSADQGSGNTHLIAQTDGSVTVTAAVTDSVGDVHTYDWATTDGTLIDTDGVSDTFSFDPSVLTPGQYTLRVAVNDGTDISNTDILLEVVATAPTLSAIDTDGDGVNDDVEGFADADGDGIADYLDNSGLASNVALEQTGVTDRFLMETESGLTASLGSVAFRAGVNATGVTMSDIEIYANDGAGVTADSGVTYSAGLFDFNISNLPVAGQSVRVVLAQFAAIPANAVYRKLVAGIWQDFVEDANNSLASAPGEAGICPPPGDVAYVSGLNEGDWCVQLTIEDGGTNDADGVVNQSISDPGGVAVKVPASGGGGSTNSIWLLMLALVPLLRRKVGVNKNKH